MSSYLMDVYGRLRVRMYNTLHRAIRKSRWGPVRCNIALRLKVINEMNVFYQKLTSKMHVNPVRNCAQAKLKAMPLQPGCYTIEHTY